MCNIQQIYVKNSFVIVNLIFIFLILATTSLYANEKKWTSTKVNQVSDKVLYDEIKKNGITKSVRAVVDGINLTVKRNGGQIKVDEITIQQYSMANENIAVLRYIINKKALLNYYKGSRGNLAELTAYIKKSVKEYNVNAFCSVNAYKILLEKGMLLDFMYQFDNGSFMTSYSIEYKDCNK